MRMFFVIFLALLATAVVAVAETCRTTCYTDANGVTTCDTYCTKY